MSSLQDPPGTSADERLAASAVTFLVDGGDYEAARVLLMCEVTCTSTNDGWVDRDTGRSMDKVVAGLRGPRFAYDILSEKEHPVTRAIDQAISAVMDDSEVLMGVTVHAAKVEVAPGWQKEMLAAIHDQRISNQAIGVTAPYTWNNLRFRSKTEARIAWALDREGVAFFANCMGRVTGDASRVNREPDFLVCDEGRWGILEVDGEPYHPPTRTVEDHERDRLFQHHGITLVEHYDAKECFNEPRKVVGEFLALLRKT